MIMEYSTLFLSAQHIHKLLGCLRDREVFIISHDDLSGRELFLKIQDVQVFIVVWDTEIRHEGDPQPDPGQIDEKIVAAQFDLRHQIQLMLLEHTVEKLAGGAFSVQHEDRVFLKLLEADPFSFQRKIMLIRYENIRKFPEAADILGIGKAGIGIVGDDEIRLAILQKMSAFDGSLVIYFNMYIGIVFVELV